MCGRSRDRPIADVPGPVAVVVTTADEVRCLAEGFGAAEFTWEIETLPAGEEAQLLFRAEAERPGEAVNRVSLTAPRISGEIVDEEPITVIQ